MKDNSLDGHRAKVALSDTALKCDLKSPAATDGNNTNFDDDYNEWELGIGDLIIDLDADIEKTNERHQQNGTKPPLLPADSFGFLAQAGSSLSMSNSKSPRLASASAASATATAAVNSTNGGNAFEHQATVDKGLKMKIKRKTVGSKYSEAKHEIVQSDTNKTANSAAHPLAESTNSANNNTACSNSNSGSNSPAAVDTPKSKHSSSKGRNSGHREKKDKNRDKNASVRTTTLSSGATPTCEVNGVMSPLKITNCGGSPPSLCSTSSPLPTSVASPGMVPSPVTNCTQDSSGSLVCQQATSSPPMPNLTLKLDNKFAPSPIPCSLPTIVIKQEERPASPPLKKIKVELPEVPDENDCPGTPGSIPETKDTSTCTSVGTVIEPDCLGPCEPGTSVMLEGIVWQETEGGVLVVNVTWRGKTYVGTLLDCTKHDWAPPRFCESPTSDVDSKTAKGRGKRGRGGNTSAPEMNLTDTRNCVQSKLRNGKGRRTTINSNGTSSGFTVPNSPAKSENNTSSSKRKGRPNEGTETNNPPMDSKSTKRSRTQNRTLIPVTPEIPQPSSPQLITCPEPNCSKRYKHPNGLKYHRAHAHSGSDSNKSEDPATEDSKDVTNSSDNEESMQESASTSPAPSFANSVPSSGAKTLLNNSETSSSSSANGLPESEPYTADLSTLASVAIGDSSAEPNAASTSQDLTTVNTGVETLTPPSIQSSVSSLNPVVPLSDMLPVSSAPVTVLSTAVTTSVIQSSSSMDSSSASSQSISVNIPTSHVIFSQGMLGSSSTTTCATSVVCNLSNPLSPSRNNLSSTVTTTFANISSIASTTISSPSSSLPMIDKCKIKQEKPDKYKPKSPLPAIRPIVPAPTPLTALSSGMPGMNLGNHCVVNPSLKPIQPKPTILGEPSTVNPSLESLKKDKSKHKKKNKDKERDKKLPLTPTKIGMGEECEALELTSYPSLDAAVSGPPHPSLSPLISQSKPSESSMDMSLPEDTMNENVQSPAYSDISDANDTAPILESEVPSGKEKEDKIGKSTPDTSQSPATNISAYGMYPYYSQPPYLLPSVSPQSAASGSQGQTIDKGDLSKKSEQERVKESRPWSNPSGESRDRQHMEQHHEIEKKQPREENVQVPTALQSGTPGGMPVQEYPLPQHYPSYPYGYVQGYPYPVEPSSYHMHMLESDPHYKQQYKQYLDEHHRMYKEQQHHQQLQQLQQQAHHHQQQQQQQAAHHSHHHSQHQSSHHHSSKSSHHSMKEDREKERSRSLDKGGLMAEQQHSSSKIQHSSSQMSSKDQDVREMDMRPPSLPAQARLDATTSSAASLKDKQTENHQILKENIELKSQMDESKSKANQYEMAMLFERHKEDMRRYYTYQDRIIEQQQQKMEPGIHHHTHHHQTIQSSHTHLQASYSSSLKNLKEDLTGSHHGSKSSSSHYGDSRSSPAKSTSDHIKSIHASTTSSPKSSRDITIKKEGGKSSGESSSDKKDKIKVEPKPEPEGQKPTMETTGPPPPPTNSYAYLHPSYLQPPPPHFAHMPFEPAMYRGGINPMLVSTPHYANPPYMHPQIRFVGPELHPSGPPAPTGPAKALDLLHQVSQQYTTTHKIHELSDHAVMSPTPTGTTPSAASTPSSSSGGGKGGSSAPPPEAAASKEDSSRSPPTQRHLHTHHHTHVGVGYPLYDPYGVAAQKTYT